MENFNVIESHSECVDESDVLNVSSYIVKTTFLLRVVLLLLLLFSCIIYMWILLPDLLPASKCSAQHS